MLLFWAQANLAVAVSDSAILDSIKPKTPTVFADEVMITATRAGDNAPTTYQLIEKQTLSKNNLGQDLPFLLDQSVSVVTTSDAGAGIGYTGMRIRGSDATRVNVTLNGIPVNDAESQNTFWVDLPDVASSTQSIQIQRGVGSSTNGGSAFGGTVSVQTQSPSIRPFGEAGVSLGSFKTFRGNLKGGTGLIKNKFFAEASGSWISSDGYIDRAASNLRSWFAQAGYMYNGTLLKLLYFGGREKTYQAWNGVPQDSLATNRTFNDLGTDYGAHFPPYKNQIDNYGQDYFQLLFSQSLPASLQLNVGLFTTLGRGYYEEYKAATKLSNYFEQDTTGIRTDLVRQKWLSNIFYGATYALNYNKDAWDITVGGQAAQYRGKHFGKVKWTEVTVPFDITGNYYDGKSLKTDVSTYAKINFEPISLLNIYADVQYRYVGYSTSGMDADKNTYNASRNWHFIQPKAGVIVKVKPEHQLYVSYALGNREPNRDDVLSAYFSNKEAKHETMHNVEAGYKWLNNSFPLQINYYMMQYNNQLVLTGRLNDVGNPIKENVKTSYRTGVELSGAIHVKRNSNRHDKWLEKRVFSVGYSFTYSINKIASFNEFIYTFDDNYSPIDSLTEKFNHKNVNISYSPSFVGGLELTGYPLKGFEISLINKAVSRQFLDNTNNLNRSIKPYFYTNLRLAYKVPLNNPDKEIRLTLLVNNLFNRLYESNGYTYSERYGYLDDNNNWRATDTYTYNYYYPQANINLLAGVNVRF